MIYYAWATRAAGIHKEGPRKGQIYAQGDLVTAGGRVLVTQSREVAQAFCPEGAQIVMLPRLPARWTDAAAWAARVKKVLVGSGRMMVQ